MPDIQPQRVALVHDWLTGMRGGEKVLEVLCELFPNATLFTLLHNKDAMSPTIEGMKIRTSFIDRLPFKTNHYRNYLPVMPFAIESMDFSDFDLIISTSHAVAKGAMPRAGAIHICYCHTPMRYVWDQYDEYFGKGRAGFATRIAMKMIAPYLRSWDVNSANRVHHFIANSKNVAERIRRIYGRESEVLHAPVDCSKFRLSTRDDGYYLIVSALVPYKRLELAIDVFNQTGDRLVVVGSGPEEAKLKSISKPNVEFAGWASGGKLADYYANCRALIFPGEEDFGIVPLEAMASGKPVIAYAKGGALETIVDGETGIFFEEQTAEALLAAIRTSQTMTFSPQLIRKHAEKFDRSVFEENLFQLVNAKAFISSSE
jgi:glycosyltransferase involved in cell wall biosynthesis